MKISNMLVCVLALGGACAVLQAAEQSKTVIGEAKCAKVDLKSQDTCQTVLQVKEGDTFVTYFVADNEVAKAFHASVCGHPQQVTATGTVEVIKGKTVLTVAKIEPAK